MKYKLLGVSVAALGAALGSPGAWALPPGSDCSLAGSGPGSEYFSKQPMSMAVGGAGLALSASESSTTQILELIGRRRLEESCPTGTVRVGGACVPEAPAAAPTAAEAAPKAKAARKARRPVSTTVDEPPPPMATGAGYGVWAEAFADYEERTDTKHKQTTTGGVVGIDKTFHNGNSGVQLGLFGAYSKIERRSSFSGTKELSTEYTVDFTSDPNLNQDLKDLGTVTYILPVGHEIDTTTRHTLDGLSIGASASFFGGGWFSDVVGKVDFFDVTGVTRGTDKFAKDINPQFVTQDPANVGCISTNNADFTKAEDFLNAQGIASEIINDRNVTTLRNYILANTFGYRFDLENGLFWEPSAGVRFIYADYGDNADKLQLEDGHSLRLEVGAKVGGGQMLQDRSIWTYAVGAYLYSDVIVDGLVITDAGSTFDNDEGKLRLRGVLQSAVRFQDGFSVYGEVGGRVGEDYWGVSGKLGGRVEW